MTYRGGTLAINVGSNCRYIATAPRRALAISGCRDDGRIGKASARDSSSARMPVATRMRARACFGGAVSRKASTNTRINTSSADGAGKSSAIVGGASFRTDIRKNPTPTRPRRECCVAGTRMASGKFTSLVNGAAMRRPDVGAA